MNVQIERKSSFTIAGWVRTFSCKGEEYKQKIGTFWQEKQGNGALKNIMKQLKPNGITKNAALGVSLSMNNETQELEYMIGIEPQAGAAVVEPKDDMASADSWQVHTVPAMTWAVFPGKGVPALMQLFSDIFTKWLPASEYEHAAAPELEVYLNEGNTETMAFEIWIPVQKKQ